MWVHVRASRGEQILHLSLVCLLLQLSLVCILGDATSDASEPQDIGVNRLNLESGPSENGEIVGLDDDGGENEISAFGEEEEQPAKTSNGQAFTWRNHHDDHGIYAGRSLMTSASSKPPDHHHTETIVADEQLDNEEIVSGATRAKILNSKIVRDEDDGDDPLATSDYAEREWQLMFRAFDSAYDSMASSILQEIGKQTNLFEDIVGKLKPQCRRDIYYIRESIKKHKLWALRMVDSNGKLPSGITYGRFSSPGDYEECLSVQVNDKLYTDVANNRVERYKFHGKYCLIDFRLPLPERPRNKLLSVHESVLNFTGTEIGRMYPEMIGNFSAYASVFYEIGYLHGFCLPSSCDVHDLTRSMTKALEGMYLIVNSTVDCEERPAGESPPIRTSQWISIALMALVFANAFAASFAHYLLPREIKKQQQRPSQRTQSNKQQQQQKPKDSSSGGGVGGGLQETLRKLSQLEEAKKIEIGAARSRRHAASADGWRQKLANISTSNKFYSDCFSIQKNFERLTKPDPRGLTFVHYTRIVAMALTVITHTGALGTLQAITKPADASNSEQIFRDLIPQMLANAFTSIQIFFFMAGFMLVISTFPSIKRDRGHISFIEYAIKRAIRLMPGIAATICLNFIWPLLVDGPMLSYFVRMIVVPCETTWWHTMGFMSNFDHVEKMCLRHSYFSASDYQLHIMAFPLLILLYKQPSLSLFLAALLTISGFVAQIIMILTKTVLPFMMVDYIDKEAFFNVVHYIHHPVWNHMSAFFYGFIVGYLVVKQIRIELSPTTIKRVWFIMMPAGVISIFAPYFWNHYKRPIYKWQMVLYVIFDRAILLTTCAWLSYATMVLARKPPAKREGPARVEPASDKQLAASNSPSPALTGGLVKSPIERVLSKTHAPSLVGDFDKTSALPGADVLVVAPSAQRLKPLGVGGGGSSGSLASLPRQRSSPNLVGPQQQHQSHHHHNNQNFDLLSPASGRLSRTTSSSNLETIAETAGQQQPASGETARSPDTKLSDQKQAPARVQPQAPVSNINTLCLVLSRLTFQLYLFNMVVLWIDVNHSKYYWFFSYYFIVFKAAAIYICSAILAMVFFIVLESPCLTLYIAWIKGRAAARAKQATAASEAQNLADLKIPVPPPLSQPPSTTIVVEKEHDDHQFGDNAPSGEPIELTTATAKSTFAFIDHPDASKTNTGEERSDRDTNDPGSENQTRM